MDSLRGPVQKKLGQPVEFYVVGIETGSSFAYVSATPLKSNGDHIDYEAIPEFTEPVRLGMFDDGLEALLRKVDGRWEVMSLRIGPTDTRIGEWTQKHRIKWTDAWSFDGDESVYQPAP